MHNQGSSEQTSSLKGIISQRSGFAVRWVVDAPFFRFLRLYFSLSPKVLPSEKQTSECQPLLDLFLSLHFFFFSSSTFLSRCCCVDVTCEYPRTKWAPCKQPKMRTAVPFVRVTGYILHTHLKKVKSFGRSRRDASFQTSAVFCCYGFLNSKRENGFADSFRLGRQVKRSATKP